jgi:hypothetical protein
MPIAGHLRHIANRAYATLGNLHFIRLHYYYLIALAMILVSAQYSEL